MIAPRESLGLHHLEKDAAKEIAGVSFVRATFAQIADRVAEKIRPKYGDHLLVECLLLTDELGKVKILRLFRQLRQYILFAAAQHERLDKARQKAFSLRAIASLKRFGEKLAKVAIIGHISRQYEVKQRF